MKKSLIGNVMDEFLASFVPVTRVEKLIFEGHKVLQQHMDEFDAKKISKQKTMDQQTKNYRDLLYAKMRELSGCSEAESREKKLELEKMIRNFEDKKLKWADENNQMIAQMKEQSVIDLDKLIAILNEHILDQKNQIMKLDHLGNMEKRRLCAKVESEFEENIIMFECAKLAPCTWDE